MVIMTVEKAKEQLVTVKKRLKLYYQREEEMLNGGVQSYGIGTRNATRYSTDLSAVKSEIEKLEKKQSELEAVISGSKKRKAIGVVPMDW